MKKEGNKRKSVQQNSHHTIQLHTPSSATSSASGVDNDSSAQRPSTSTSTHHEEDVNHALPKYVIVKGDNEEHSKVSRFYNTQQPKTTITGVEDSLLDPSSQTLPYSSTPYGSSTEFSGMDAYPLTQHLHNSAGTTYVYADPTYPTGYYQYQPSNVHSPQQSYVHHQPQQPNSPNSLDEDGGNLGHTARASPATIKWLLDNYETADGTSLPRCTLYDHYKKHCIEHTLDPVNAASFGKLIRSVFLGLRTRRLGTRGNSKYHYYGIRIKPDSPLNRLHMEDYHRERDTVKTVRRIQPTTTLTLRSSVNNQPTVSSYSNEQTSSSFNSYDGQTEQPEQSPTSRDTVSDGDRIVLGDGQVPQLLPSFNGLEESLGSLKMNTCDVMKFVNAYSQHYEGILYSIKELQFDQVEECWNSFWQPEGEDMDEDGSYCSSKEDRLTQSQIFSLCTIPQIQQYIIHMDYSFYQVLIDVMIVDVLSTTIAPSLITQIRNFAKGLEDKLKKAMMGAPDCILKRKGEVVRMLAHALRRYTSLNHLATAARGVLQKQDQITQMFEDFNRVDMVCVQEQAGWVCACDPLMVQHLQNAFRDNLQSQKSLEEWAEWMEAVVDNILAKYHDKPVNTLAEVAKQFLLNWSFYSSMVIRDLTLRSAQSFGSFHLIRLLFDEYMLYLVEQRLAKAANRPAVSIMSPHENSMEWILMEEDASLIDVHSVSTSIHNGIHDGMTMGHLQSIDSSHSQWKVNPQPLGDVDIMYMDENKSMQYIVPGEQVIERQVVIGQSGDVIDVGDKMLDPKAYID